MLNELRTRTFAHGFVLARTCLVWQARLPDNDCDCQAQHARLRSQTQYFRMEHSASSGKPAPYPSSNGSTAASSGGDASTAASANGSSAPKAPNKGSAVGPSGAKVPVMQRLQRTIAPAWLTHLNRNAVLDGDGIFLHRQSQDQLQGALSAV